ncbi:hypothetical protein DFJ43DRAFT_1155581 [Lentinula guzmanii]|uniref:CxC6 like cysteine cluster associated with KDZ domain-containing protein n=1 Tax=Lentinula guzmanii TaxID=2804957 RepID=A0AA38J8F7_9AGAR|nr:hypothetical protein DFJ43DRAFT_1155581 [Lentinula guzmanii]
MVAGLWTSLRHYIWNLQQPHISHNERRIFDEHGSRSEKKHLKLAYFMFFPPHTTCPQCGHTLTNISRIPVAFFTRDGPFPAYSTSLRCKSDTCGIRYYFNYSVKIDARTCVYYDEAIPEVIHLEEKAFIETSLSELFTTCTLFAWVSAQNSALIYNYALSSYGQCEVKQSHFLLTSTQVRRAFVLVSLLKDWREQGRNIVVREDGDLDSRLKDLICERNDRMIMEGQPERLHACDICEKLIPTDIPNSYKGLRSLRAVVTDGTAVGHYCCKVHNCTIPLANNRHHFCPKHMDQQHSCVFTDCDLPARIGHRTCSTPEHSRYEDYRDTKAKAFFLLRQRLQRVGVQQPQSLDAPSEGGSVDLPDDNGDPAHKSDKGNWPSRVMFSHRTTHNEQLVVCTCGVIAARATMYGAESISGVKDFMKSVYPNPQDLPDVIFYDNNCHLQSHLQAQQDDFFHGTMLPVDVFHFKSKHKESDEFCQKHCNPAQWTELVGTDGEWIFNSSAAEQSNVWIGGYQAVLRDMLAHNFDFFLDEMIKQRNVILVAKLRQEGKAPYCIPPYPSST